MAARLVLAVILLLLAVRGRAQHDPSDPLGPAFRLSRRAAIRAELPPQSCAVFFSGGFKGQTAGSAEPRPFFPDPSFLYLTGLSVPDAVLLVFQKPMQLAEGTVGEVLFLPDQHDQALRLMGEDFKGKFGMAGNGMAIRPATQWRKFCIEVLSTDELKSVYTLPVAETDYRKRGELAYTDLGGIFYANLAPGFAFDPTAQHFYREILRVDSAGLKPLVQRVNAHLNYYPDVRRDPILDAFSRAQSLGDLARVQAQVRTIKIDLFGLEAILERMRIVKTAEEQTLLAKAGRIAVEALECAASGKPAGRMEYQLAAAAAYCVHYRGGRLPVAVHVAAGKHAALPYYNRNADTIPAKGLVVVDIVAEYGGYMARVARTLPASGKFEGKDAELYNALRKIHQSAIADAKAGAKPSTLLEGADEGFNGLLKSLDLVGGKGILRVLDLSPIGLDLNEFAPPAVLAAGMAFTLETAIYFSDESSVRAEWRGKGAVLRDLVLITPGGARVLTDGFPTEVLGIEAVHARGRRLVLD